MRVTEYYDLKLRQSQIDFVDVDVSNDIPLFVDPQAFLSLPSDWAHECVSAIQNYFQTVLDAIRNGNSGRALELLSALREPNETHLGLSKGVSKGSGVGEKLAVAFWKSLSSSKAVRTGLVQDLEDTALLVDGIRSDRISDIATNIIRPQLLTFTQEACEYYGIPMEEEVNSGPLWDAQSRQWWSTLTRRPIADGKPLLLVPKSVVRFDLSYSPDEYFNNYVLSYLQERDSRKAQTLGRVLRSDAGSISKRALKERYGVGKRVNRWVSEENPETLEKYRHHKRAHPTLPLDHFQLEVDDEHESGSAELDRLLQAVLDTPAGRQHADNFHRNVEYLLSAVFYPALVNPRREFPMHEGRKRVDITYTNAAESGFFAWLGTHYPSAYIFVECKNYTRPVGNPEYDQVSGRFSPSRGKFGILVYRGYASKRDVIRSCRDTALDQRGFVLPLDDDDLKRLVQERKRPVDATRFDLLQDRFNELI
jgi:hypothetical protein